MSKLRRKHVYGFLLLAAYVNAASSQGQEVIISPAHAFAHGQTRGTMCVFPERLQLANGELIEFERGLLMVPLVRDDPHSKLIMVEFCRFKKEHDGDGIPPVFKLHGGPGFRGLTEPSQGYLENNVWPATRELGTDYVVVGQRGIGSSKPHTLIDTVRGSAPDKPISNEDFSQALQDACRTGKAYWESKGFNLRGFNVIEAAGDVDAVRKALGYDQIIITGTSFGSHWGIALMRYYPQTVARAVFSGMEGPDHTWDMPSYVLNSLRRIAAEAEQDTDIVDRLAGVGLIEALSDVIESLENTPVVESVTTRDEDGESERKVLLDAWAIRNLVLSNMWSRDGIRELPARVIAWHERDFAKAAAQHIENCAPWNDATASFFLMDCGSGISPKRRAEVRMDTATILLGQINSAYRAAEPIWNVDLGAEFRGNFETDIPTVLVHGTWDVSTPLENAMEIAPYFTNGKLIVVHRGSHGALREAINHSPGFKSALLRFMRSGDPSTLPEKVELPTVAWAKPWQATK